MRLEQQGGRDMNKLKGGREQKAILNSIVLFAEDVYFLTKLEDNQLKKNKTEQTTPKQASFIQYIHWYIHWFIHHK